MKQVQLYKQCNSNSYSLTTDTTFHLDSVEFNIAPELLEEFLSIQEKYVLLQSKFKELYDLHSCK
ncbi:MAG: hypothetical protein ACM31H_06170 [Nitrososphaerales archaeon]